MSNIEQGMLNFEAALGRRGIWIAGFSLVDG
jgi:hypothetical protein